MFNLNNMITYDKNYVVFDIETTGFSAAKDDAFATAEIFLRFADMLKSR